MFPRFYFIGDDDLLEILGQAKNPAVIHSHLQTLFAGIFSVKFSEGDASIIAMCSLEGEVVPLAEPVPVSDTVEVWLALLNTQMRATLVQLVANTIGSRLNIAATPSQVLDLAERVTFTRQCEEAVNRGRPALEKFKGELLERLGQYTSLETDEPLVTLKVKALVLDLIHHMDVVDQLIAAGTSSAGEWQWRKQLRFGAGADGTVTIHIVSASFDYTAEYQGTRRSSGHAAHRQVLPHADAGDVGAGGPYSPAGTGKTESVKALGAFGRQVLVFNCDEGIDRSRWVESSWGWSSAARGAASTSSTGCRSALEISQQIQVIQAAIKARQPRMELEGTTTEVDANAGILSP